MLMWLELNDSQVRACLLDVRSPHIYEQGFNPSDISATFISHVHVGMGLFGCLIAPYENPLHLIK